MYFLEGFPFLLLICKRNKNPRSVLTILKLLKSDIEMLNYPFQMASIQDGMQKKSRKNTRTANLESHQIKKRTEKTEKSKFPPKLNKTGKKEN